MSRNASIIASLMLLAITSQAQTYYVSTNGTDTNTGADWATALLTISNGVAKTGGSGTVLVGDGTFTLSTQIVITTGITITSLNGAVATIVDGNNATRGFFVSNAIAVVDGFTITRGYTTTNGGGVYMYYGTIRNCIISNNLALGNGGGIFLVAANASNCTISDNVSSNSGGGLYTSDLITSPYSAIRNCIITGNQCTNYGGGAYIDHCTMTNCTIAGNTSRYYGGGVMIWHYGTLTDSTISTNTATQAGGGVFMRYAEDRMNNCTVAVNQVTSATSTDGGGGVLVWWSGIVSNCLVAGNTNTGGYGGGGMSLRSGAQVWNCVITSNKQTGNYAGGVNIIGGGRIHNSTISKNTASGGGGGVHSGENGGNIGLISNCLVFGNQASSGGGVHMQDANDRVINCTIVSNTATTYGGGVVFQGIGSRVTNSIVYFNTHATSSNYYYYAGNGTGFFYSCTAPYPADGIGNITADPLLADLANGDVHLKSKGGRWLAGTWVADSYHSPCIDAGDPTFPVGAEPMPNGNRINMGFYGGTAQASMKCPKGTIFRAY